MGRPNRRRGYISTLTAPYRLTVSGAAVAAVLSACSAPSTPAPGGDFDPPPVEPVEVAGLTRCVGLEGETTGEGVGDRLPQLELPCLNERRRVDVSRLAGPAVVNLWASWCGPCRKEMPMLADAARANPDVRFVGISTQDNPQAAADFLTRTGVTYPQLVDVDGLVLADTRVPGLPVTLALDAEGRVVERVIGEVSDEELATLLDALAQG